METDIQLEADIRMGQLSKYRIIESVSAGSGQEVQT